MTELKERAYCIVCTRRRNTDKMKPTPYGHVCHGGACEVKQGSLYHQMMQQKERTIKFFETMLSKKVFPQGSLFKKPAKKKR